MATVIQDTDSTSKYTFAPGDSTLILEAVISDVADLYAVEVPTNYGTAVLIMRGGLIYNNLGAYAVLPNTGSNLVLRLDATSAIYSPELTYISDGNIDITNFGLIETTTTAVTQLLGSFALSNHGEISGSFFIQDPSENASIVNAGILRSPTIFLATNDTIDNSGQIISELALSSGTDKLFNSGTLRGATAISGFTDEKTIVNNGLIETTVTDGTGYAIDLDGDFADRLVNTGTIRGHVDLSGGADVYDGRLGRILGTVYGGGGDDTLLGGDGDETFNGGAGFNNYMAGGRGNDTYEVSMLSDRVYEDVGSGRDVVLAYVSYQLGADSEIEFMFNASGGGLILIGNEFAQRIEGNNSADTLQGAGGADVLVGNGGDDTYELAAFTGMTIIDTAGAADRIASTISRSLVPYDTIEELALFGTAAINGTGNGLANTIEGNGAANVIDGGALNDLMRGGAGSDTYIVDNLLDTVDEQNLGGAGVDLVISSVNFNLNNSPRVLGVLENLTLTGSAVSGIGNAQNNILTGNAVANTLQGGLGSDTLIGRGGIDTVSGGGGNDFFVFNAPLAAANRDTIIDFANASGNNDTFRLENAVMTKLGAAGALKASFFKVVGSGPLDANDYIQYNRATGSLVYDSNGSGAGGAIQLATLTNKPLLTVGDFVVI